MKRVPIRLRLTIGFAVVTALVLVTVGAFSYHRLAAGFSDDLNRELAQRAQDLVAAVQRPGGSLSTLAGTGFIERGESFAELETSRGETLQSTSTLHGAPLLTPEQAARASGTTVYVDLPSAPGLDEPARVLATPVRVHGRAEVLVVGATRENGLETLRRVRHDMALGGALLFLLVSGLAYLLAGAALRPVEAMRRRAEAITADTPGQRLPLPAADDEVSRLGRTLNDLLARVDDAVERERAFVANASHELRTPLALLRMELELAVRRPRSAAALVAAISSAEAEVERLSRLAEDLLVLARASADGLPLARERVFVPDLLEAAAARFTGIGQAAGRVVRADAGVVGWLRADRQRLEHALHDMVDNALQHGRGDIEICATRTAQAVELHVRDEGPGFDAEIQAAAFGRFTRSARSRGAGLGLAIVAAVAAAHGGTAQALNRPGSGADVWISLPPSDEEAPSPDAGEGLQAWHVEARDR